MNNNPNRGNSRERKQMNAIAKTALGAVLVALGLTLKTWAAEPAATSNTETRNVQPDWSKFDWDKLNAQALAEYTRPVRPGIPGKFPFLNVRGGHNQGHMYAPNFDFGAVPGAKHYRFTVTHWGDDREYRVLVYESPVLPAGLHTLKLRVTDGYSVPDYVEIDTPRDEHATNTVRVNDATVGADTNQFEYLGKWTHGKGAAHSGEKCLEGDISYSNTAGDTMRIRFSGTRIRLYGAMAPTHGTGMVSVDDGKEHEAVFRSGKKVLGDKTWVFEAPEPWVALAPVWTELPVCLMPGTGYSPNRPEKTGNTFLRLTVEGLDAPGGKAIGKAKIGTAETLEFRKAQPFQGPLEQPKTTLREASPQAIRHSAAGVGTGMQYMFYRDHRLPIETPRGPALAKFQRIESVFVAGGIWVGDSMTFLARESKDPDEVAMAVKTARNAADTIINTANPADWKYAHHANMVRNRGAHWNAYLAGEKTYEEWLADMHAQSAKGYSMMWDCRSGDPGLMYLDVYDVTKDAKYLEAAKRLAAAWRDTQLPSGTWPYHVNPVTGERRGGDYPPALTIWFLDRLSIQYGVRDFEQTADRAFNWVLENQVKPLDLRAHYWDANPGPRTSQGALAASEIAMVLFHRAAREKNAEYTAMGEEIVRWIEDWFIRWEADGVVLEQSRDRADVAFTGGGVVQAYVKAHEMTGNPLYLTKALRMANRLMNDWVNKGGYGWAFYSAPRAAVCLLEAYPYLKKNNLPGGE